MHFYYQYLICKVYILFGFTCSVLFDYLKLTHLTTANQFVLLILIIGKYCLFCFRVEAYEKSSQDLLKRALILGAWSCVGLLVRCLPLRQIPSFTAVCSLIQWHLNAKYVRSACNKASAHQGAACFQGHRETLILAFSLLPTNTEEDPCLHHS